MWLWQPYRDNERRRNVRLPADVDVAMTGPAGTVQGRSTNLSRGGVCVLVREALLPGTTVFVRIETIGGGFAHVRRCVARGANYEVALQFRDGLMLDDRAIRGFDHRRETSVECWDGSDE